MALFMVWNHPYGFDYGMGNHPHGYCLCYGETDHLTIPSFGGWPRLSKYCRVPGPGKVGEDSSRHRYKRYYSMVPLTLWILYAGGVFMV